MHTVSPIRGFALILSSSKLLGGQAVTSISPRAGPVPGLGLDPVLECVQSSLLHHSLSGSVGSWEASCSSCLGLNRETLGSKPGVEQE